MPLDTLTLVPDQAGYSVEKNADTLSVRLDGGASKFRRDILGAALNVQVQWTISGLDYEVLQNFYDARNGADPFLINLITRKAILELHEAHFMPGQFRLTSITGNTYVVTAQLEVTPLST